MIISNANRTFTVVRNVSELFNGIAAASITLTYQPPRESLLQTRVHQGTSNTGTVTFTGVVVTSPGQTASASETLTFTKAGYKTTARRFQSVSSVATTGFADEADVPTVVVKSTGADGSVQHAQTTLKTSWPGFLDTTKGQYYGERPGMTNEEILRLFIQYDETWTPRVGDIFKDEYDNAQYFVRANPVRMGGTYPRFWELRVTRRDESA